MSSTLTGQPRQRFGTAALRLRDSLPGGTLRAAVAGAEAAVFTWLCVVVPAVATYVATAAAPALGDATWLEAAAVGSGVWRLAHGGALATAGAVVTVVPLGLTALAVVMVAVSLRRARVLSGPAVVAAAGGYAAVAVVLASLSPAADGGPGRPALGALLVGATGALLGQRRSGGRVTLPSGLRADVRRVPGELRAATAAGMRGAAVAGAGLGALGVLLVVTSLVVANVALVEVFTTLRPDVLGVAMMLLASALLLPTVALWAVSWAAGTGFAVGEGTLVTPEHVVVGPVPAFPLLAGLPGPSPVGAWTATLVVLVGLGTGWFLHRRTPQRRLLGSVGSALVAAFACAGGAALLGVAAGGSAGPGRMAQVGPDPIALGVAVGAEVAVGAVVAVVLARPDTLALGRALVHRFGGAVRVLPDGNGPGRLLPDRFRRGPA